MKWPPKWQKIWLNSLNVKESCFIASFLISFSMGYTGPCFTKAREIMPFHSSLQQKYLKWRTHANVETTEHILFLSHNLKLMEILAWLAVLQIHTYRFLLFQIDSGVILKNKQIKFLVNNIIIHVVAHHTIMECTKKKLPLPNKCMKKCMKTLYMSINIIYSRPLLKSLFLFNY